MRGRRRAIVGAGYADLSVTAPTGHSGRDAQQLSASLQALANYGYSTVAVNQEVGGSKPVIPEPLKVRVETSASGAGLRVLSRMTLTLTDAKSTYLLSSSSSTIMRKFDLVAARPMTDKLLAQCVDKLDMDIITFDISQRMPFFVKTTHVSQALARGIFFELCYSPVIQDETARRNAIANAQNIVRICKGKNIIISSGTGERRLLRAPRDVFTLTRLFGLTQDQCVAAVSQCAMQTVSRGFMRTSTFRGVTAVVLTKDTPKGVRVHAEAFVGKKSDGDDAALCKARGHGLEGDVGPRKGNRGAKGAKGAGSKNAGGEKAKTKKAKEEADGAEHEEDDDGEQASKKAKLSSPKQQHQQPRKGKKGQKKKRQNNNNKQNKKQ
ncbi:hypothetical protein PTSG_01673 [Salpingoeca rosetta]|uniref:Uncharacterized protein n=1 Tax=Salpingoeca rosetta (strain ATCC 50818 / BSB-021) TaxID=946362 RepID=F2TYM1_SALR5|nr:uncharacterized protein PTSG_01673 [Salpingoeca rosetta]EGD78695.1 hypothetical protein PTSG_01673 [Salpingoeca rosetta]|eukprot:XP_004997652.1 hypothetical protein PTSG_01673 [Salpingoeca rosetta]